MLCLQTMQELAKLQLITGDLESCQALCDMMLKNELHKDSATIVCTRSVVYNTRTWQPSYVYEYMHHNHTTTVLQPFFRDHPGEPVPEEKFWALWCKGRLTEADTPTIQLGTTPSRLTSTHLHHLPICFIGRIPFLLPNQQRQSTESTCSGV